MIGKRAVAFAALLASLGLAVASPSASADALYPAGSDGTWTGDTVSLCDNAAWTSPHWGLWAITGQGRTYPFDVPNPTFILGETVTIKLTPIVVGTLPGTVSLSGTDTATATVSGPGWDMLTPQPILQLTYQPGGSTTGTVQVPAQWASTFPGFVGLDAKLTGDRGTNAEITILAQGLRRCSPFSTSVDEPASPTIGGWLVPTAIGLLAFLFVLRGGSVPLRRPVRPGPSVGDDA